MTLPAATATLSGPKAESPRAIRSALTNSVTPKASRSSAGPAVDLPAPFGPARAITLGAACIWAFMAARSWARLGLQHARLELAEVGVHGGAGERAAEDLAGLGGI